MAPRQILANKTPQPADLHHINGDWYKLIPTESFSLDPGKSITIDYRGVEAVIKETDRPLGLYFVFYDKQQAEAKIVEVTDYTWTAFTKPEQINRNAEDEEPIPTAERIYGDNLGMSEVPAAQLMRITPSPVKMQIGSGALQVTNQLPIYYQNGLDNEAKYLAASLKEITGTEFRLVTTQPKEKSISLEVRQTSRKEAYELKITGDGISITGSDAAGVFYGVQSLRSLVPVEQYKTPSPSFSLPYVDVEDAPRFAFRGLHLDVSRNFSNEGDNPSPVGPAFILQSKPLPVLYHRR